MMTMMLQDDACGTPEMSVVEANLKKEKEVNTVTNTAAINTAPATTAPATAAPMTTAAAASQELVHTPRSSANYNATERLVAHVGLGLLRWSNRRVERARPSHERMALLLENERVRSRHDSTRSPAIH